MLRMGLLGAALGAVGALDNRGVVFVKPHAATEATIQLARTHLEKSGITVLGEATVTGEDIAAQGTIDKHYMALAKNALGGDRPGDRTVDAELIGRASSDAKKAFQKAFGVELPAMSEEGRILRADVAPVELEMDVVELEARWRDGASIKLGPGCYISDVKMDSPPEKPTFCINGFYPTLRSKFTQSGAKVPVFLVSFPPSKVSWAKFRGEVIGATDPAKAQAGSLRAEILSRWEELGLPGVPNVGDNGVHASAGPVEAIREMGLWAASMSGPSPLEEQLRSVSEVAEKLDAWLEDGTIELGGTSGSTFDLTEEMDADELLEQLSALVP